MKYTELAGQKVSNMSLGTVQLGLNYGIANRYGKPDKQKLFPAKRSFENGITSLDTARGYGDSEQVIGGFSQSDLKANSLHRPSALPLFPPVRLISCEKEIIDSVETS